MPIEINLSELERLISLEDDSSELLEAMGEAVQDQLKDYLEMLDGSRTNKLGGERTHFYQTEADGTTLNVNSKEAVITIPHPYSQKVFGGRIEAKNVQNLTIPARAEAYGHSAGDFDDLRFGMFHSGTKFLAQKGTGLIFFWLVPFVDQEADPEALPSISDMEDRAGQAAEDWWIAQASKTFTV